MESLFRFRAIRFITYADGHAKWTKPEKTWRGYTDNDWRRTPTTP